jgi:Fe-S-cluster containining protein
MRTLPDGSLENAAGSGSGDPGEYIEATADLVVFGRPLRLNFSMPAGRIKPVELLPLFQSMADSFAGLALKDAWAQGINVSCRKGCGVCCRQLVPISEIEAHQLLNLVNDMPEPRKSEIRARFDAGRQHLKNSGLLEKLLGPDRLQPEERTPFALNYFYQGIACPFLEEGSCSIYIDRPTPCREYLVTTAAENCARPSPEAVRCLEMPAEVSRAVRCLNPEQNPQRWVALILALDWAETHPDGPPPRPGPEIVREVLCRLVGKEPPGNQPGKG